MPTFRQGDDIVSNKGRHQHRGQPCQDCGEIVITPVLTQEDFEQRVTAAHVGAQQQWQENTLNLLRQTMIPCPLDYLLLEMVNRMGAPMPQYIILIGARYANERQYGGMPPHTQNDDVTDWWVTE
jgi:hypothetical protein